MAVTLGRESKVGQLQSLLRNRIKGFFVVFTPTLQANPTVEGSASIMRHGSLLSPFLLLFTSFVPFRSCIVRDVFRVAQSV